MSQTATNKTIVSHFFDALNRGDLEHIIDAYSDDACLVTMGNTLVSGCFNRGQIEDALKRIVDVFPAGLKFSVVGLVAEDDKVAVEAQSEGEHISGQTYCNQYHFLFQFRAGKLVSLKEYLDTETVTDVLCGGQRPPFGT